MLSRTRRFLSILAVLVLATVCAQAQKPALTKSVDEPGRSPYTSRVLDICRAGCVLNFTPVPAGFRLVVTHVAVGFTSTLLSKYVYLQSGNDTFSAFFLPVPNPAGDDYFITSTPVTYYVEPGVTPQMVVPGTATATATIVGYLVAIP